MQKATIQPQWVVEAIAARRQQRKEAWDNAEKKALEWKEKGNTFFRDGQYRVAAECYLNACNEHSTNPTYYSNLCAAYLKVGTYELAVKMSTVALLLDPTHKKVRFRRLQARKGLGFYQGALSDANAIVRLADPNDPALPEVQREIKDLKLLIQKRPPHLRGLNTTKTVPEQDPKDDWPDENEKGVTGIDNEEYPSESEDAKHEGNNIPCRYYNRQQGCKHGTACKFSHASDDMSVRDLMGKNVCIYHILGRCRFSDDHCHYSHEKSALPEDGWWTTALGKEEVSKSMQGKAKTLGKKIKRSKGQRDHQQRSHFSFLLERELKKCQKRRYDYDDELSEDDEIGNRLRRAAGLFTEEEEYELLCQGVKPWEEDAARVLGVLYGDYDYDDYGFL